MDDINHLDFQPDENFGQDEVDETESDPNIVAFLDQQQEDWKQRREQFAEWYGFDHACNCSDDYAANRTQAVTECFIRLCGESLDRNVEATQEVRTLSKYLNEMLKMTAELSEIMRNNGLEEQLEEYFNTEKEFEDVEGDSLDDNYETYPSVIGDLDPDEEDADDDEQLQLL